MIETLDTPGGFIRATGTEAVVCRLIASRQALGRNQYDKTASDNDVGLRKWLLHQQAVLADALVYCTRAIEELDKTTGDDYK